MAASLKCLGRVFFSLSYCRNLLLQCSQGHEIKECNGYWLVALSLRITTLGQVDGLTLVNIKSECLIYFLPFAFLYTMLYLNLFKSVFSVHHFGSASRGKKQD